MMLLLIDNYDSFTYNLAHLFGELGVEVVVRRNDEITVDGGGAARALAPRDLAGARPARGRGRVGGDRAGVRRRVPMLGVCLGHQAIVEVFGGEIGQARALVHGKATNVSHDGRGHLRGAPGGLRGGALPLARGDVGARRASRSRRRPPTAR